MVGALLGAGVLDGAVAVAVTAPFPHAENATLARRSAAGVRIIIPNVPGERVLVEEQLQRRCWIRIEPTPSRVAWQPVVKLGHGLLADME